LHGKADISTESGGRAMLPDWDISFELISGYFYLIIVITTRCAINLSTLYLLFLNLELII
jgi:hypothetical protein